MNGWLYNLARGLEWEEKGQIIYRNGSPGRSVSISRASSFLEPFLFQKGLLDSPNRNTKGISGNAVIVWC